MPRTVVNEFGETVVTMTLQERGPLTDEERRMIRNARNMSPVFDEDCPPMPDAMRRQIEEDIASKRVARP